MDFALLHVEALVHEDPAKDFSCQEDPLSPDTGEKEVLSFQGLGSPSNLFLREP
jgi:hypothetical protein